MVSLNRFFEKESKSYVQVVQIILYFEYGGKAWFHLFKTFLAKWSSPLSPKVHYLSQVLILFEPRPDKSILLLQRKLNCYAPDYDLLHIVQMIVEFTTWFPAANFSHFYEFDYRGTTYRTDNLLTFNKNGNETTLFRINHEDLFIYQKIFKKS